MLPMILTRFRFRFFASAFALLACTLASVASVRDDSVAVKESWPFYKKGVIGKVYDYFANSNTTHLTRRPNFTFIGGPSYSKDTKFSIGILSAGLYSTVPSDTLLPPSNISVVGEISTAGYYMAGIRGLHIFPSDAHRINYNLKFSSFETYFWGIGFDSQYRNSNRTSYTLLNISLRADYTWRLRRKLYIGPMIDVDYSRAASVENPSLWDGEPLSTLSSGLGLVVKYDSRDNHNTPYTGELVELSQLFYPNLYRSRSRYFTIAEFSAAVYRPVWRGGVVATRLHGEFSIGKPLWNKLPRLGGAQGMRGYYEGRYRDNNTADVIVELRQHVWRRSGMVVWGGLGTIFRNPSDIEFRKLLPNIGIGYRWEFKKRTNVRLDFGIGRRESGLVFQINEAF